MRFKRGKTQERGRFSGKREADREKRLRALRLLGATEAQIQQGGRGDKDLRIVLFRLLSERSSRVQATPGWADKPCPCTLREPRPCPVHDL